MFAFAAPRRTRRPALTPLIDVVFLLLVFFMLASQFGREGAMDLSASDGAGDYTGPPRLVAIRPDGVTLNGVALAEAGLADALQELVASPDDAIVLQGVDGADVQRLADIVTDLTAAGFTRLILAE